MLFVQKQNFLSPVGLLMSHNDSTDLVKSTDYSALLSAAQQRIIDLTEREKFIGSARATETGG